MMIARGFLASTCSFCCAAIMAASADAGVLHFDFVHEGFSEGAFVSGTFYGEDLNSDGFLSFISGEMAPFEELTGFDAEFSGNSLVPAFTLSLDDPESQAALVYDLEGGPILGEDTDVIFGLDELMVIVSQSQEQP